MRSDTIICRTPAAGGVQTRPGLTRGEPLRICRPSFREALSQDALKSVAVPRGAYNGYECEVNEEYCGKCHLFLGHSLKDGAEAGDTHPSAEWRHCVLSLSLKFTSDKPT